MVSKGRVSLAKAKLGVVLWTWPGIETLKSGSLDHGLDGQVEGYVDEQINRVNRGYLRPHSRSLQTSHGGQTYPEKRRPSCGHKGQRAQGPEMDLPRLGPALMKAQGFSCHPDHQTDNQQTLKKSGNEHLLRWRQS